MHFERSSFFGSHHFYVYNNVKAFYRHKHLTRHVDGILGEQSLLTEQNKFVFLCFVFSRFELQF